MPKKKPKKKPKKLKPKKPLQPSKPKKKIGRPSKFREIDQEQLKKITLAGWTDIQIADFIGITERTLNRWKNTHPAFCQSIKDWKNTANEQVEKSLFIRANGYSHPEDKIFCSSTGKVTIVKTIKQYPPDPTSMIYWSKNRDPKRWRDKLEHQHYGHLELLTKAIKKAKQCKQFKKKK